MKICPLCQNEVEDTLCERCKMLIVPEEIDLDFKAVDENEEVSLGDDDTDSSIDFVKSYWNKNSVEDLNKEWKDKQEQKRKRWFERGNTVFAACVLAGLVGFAAYRGVFYFQNKQLEDTYSDHRMEMKDYYENSPDYNYLDAIKPIDTKQEVGKTIYYYSSEDIKELGRGCDSEHMEYTVEDFGEFLAAELSEAVLTESTMFDGEGMNYCIVYNDGRRSANFEKYYSARSSGIHMKIDADTATGKIHGLEFVEMPVSERLYEITSKWLTQNGSDIFTSEYLKENVNEAMQNGSYELSEGGFSIRYYASDDYVSISISPEEKND